MNGKYAVLVAAEDGLIREVLNGFYRKEALGPSSLAIFRLFGRIGNSWRSVHVMLQGSKGAYELESCANDCAAILRCMLDASLQIAYILVQPEEAEERGQLYLDYEHVERYQMVKDVLPLDNPIVKRLRESARRAEAEPRVRAEYERVKGKYTHGKGSIRSQWYPGNLRQLAKAVGKEEEYLLFVKQFSSAIHSGPMATRYGASASTRRAIDATAGKIVAQTAAMLVAHEALFISERSAAILEATPSEISASVS